MERDEDAGGFDCANDWDGDSNVDPTVSGADGLGVTHTFTTGGSTTVIVTATDKDGGTNGQVSHTIELIQPVNADVKPGNSQNNVNAKSEGVIAVVDGDLDLILHFRTQTVKDTLGVDLNSGESVTVDAQLTGETIEEVMPRGLNSIESFQPGKGKGKSK